ncbi:MAG: hypothetical protein SangKO_011420 [Sandaracinaceae bacterium]
MTEALDRNDWTLGEVLDAHREAMQNELHTALVGRVQSYDVDQIRQPRSSSFSSAP